ncbi:acyl-CoA dehydrogenase family protein [Pseudonocardia asaccharolytica]|uniref:Acyl-CoA dehydrogenase n=1 Tax=Pseudonocardia asaccharolytica DSM 44247 = NBRC 16224 TaxID=1123024 RepID=A0A511D4V5_9PSEU|nr:acyl-CoA dehydrogenase family protein [Pseudonocardia asaccharolytica]GEL18634.1 acyl-CoA dehydrogenase [Pseudonocardia asaccharolytica DSM 44247 = NBRC 16224]
MYFALTDDQREFDAAVRGYLAERFDLAAVRGEFEDAVSAEPVGEGHPEALWKAAAEQGWPAVLVPEDHEGLGLGMVEAQVIARALGAGMVPGPWRGTVLAGEAIRLAGSDEQQADWLPRVASGEVVGALALRGSAPGTIPGVEYGRIAGVAVVRSGVGLALVERPGSYATPQRSYDGTTRLASLSVPDAGAVLPRASEAMIVELTARATVLVAADLVGIARESLSRTVAYDRERLQFGVPVGSFQAIKHALADLHVGVTMAEHAVLYAAYAVESGLAGRELAVAVAKAKAGDAALQSTAAMIQYHGGIGYTWEHETHFFYKRAKRLAGQFGDSDAQRQKIASLTLGPVSA